MSLAAGASGGRKGEGVSYHAVGKLVKQEIDHHTKLYYTDGVVVMDQELQGVSEWKDPAVVEKYISPYSWKRVRTSKRYRDILEKFLNWAEEERWLLERSRDADYVGYLYIEHIIMCGLPKSWGLALSAAIKFHDPEAREGKMPWLTEGVEMLENERPVQSHAPALLPHCIHIAVGQRCDGDPEGGMLTLVNHSGWLRPGEGAEIKLDDVHLPEEITLLAGGTSAIVRVAPTGRATKVGRPQPAEIDPGPGLVALRALMRRARREGRQRLCVKGYPGYAKSFVSAASKRLPGLNLTAHAPRAGGATEAKHRKMSEPRICTKGRWASRTAARVYLDQIGALAAAQRLPEATEKEMLYECHHLLEVFPELREGLLEWEEEARVEVVIGTGGKDFTRTAPEAGREPAAQRRRTEKEWRPSIVSWW